MLAASSLLLAAVFPLPSASFQDAFGPRPGALVMIDCANGQTSRHNLSACVEKLPPCSTFKIWNTLIGLETGKLSSVDAPFYKWDEVTRSIPEWNRNLTLREAFQVSCVPAFQALARQIGAQPMKEWIDKIGYGDRNLKAGIDVFWLPAPGRKTLLISPEEQAFLLYKLTANKLTENAPPLKPSPKAQTPGTSLVKPLFSEKSRAVLKDVMRIVTTDLGILYGKTGTSLTSEGKPALGWFVGYVETQGKTYAFACTLKNAAGKDARQLIEQLLRRQGML
jgi:beta-lactamase class D